MAAAPSRCGGSSAGLLALVALLSLVFLAACATPQKKGNLQDDMLVPMPARLDINPDTDIDYGILRGETVYFAFDSSIIQASERGKLARVLEWMQANPRRPLFLAGHADKRGTPEYNRGLAERRAQAVRMYLIGLGAEGELLHTISYGEERPAAQGDSEQDFALNRRVEVGVVREGAVQRQGQPRS
ncbi:hypothetical protein DB346_17595 [Verrucomicrobia bacterium LW23]|nr:hypothetical protein DB346_17595 [Verrucomicrobia bacterium LW23]